MRTIKAAEDLLVPTINPLQVCRVVLSVMHFERDSYATPSIRGPLRELLASLQRAIEYNARRGVKANDTIISACLNHCTALNQFQPEFVPSDLVNSIQTLSKTGGRAS